MAVRRLHPDQPPQFAFTAENLAWAHATIAKYPPGKEASAVLPLMWRAQEQCGGWLPEPAIRAVCDLLDMAYIRGIEIATFYTMFQLAPVGSKAHVQVCGTTPCMLRGSRDLVAVCKRRIGEHQHVPSADGTLSWEEVECIGVVESTAVVALRHQRNVGAVNLLREGELIAQVWQRHARAAEKPGLNVERRAKADVRPSEHCLEVSAADDTGLHEARDRPLRHHTSCSRASRTQAPAVQR